MIYQFGVLLFVGTYISMTLAFTKCPCTREWTPVCGTNGKTYSNPCELNCAKQYIKNLQVSSSGPCAATQPQRRPCSCTKILSPVCASNGATYSNDCMMRCAGAELKVVKYGPCYKK